MANLTAFYIRRMVIAATLEIYHSSVALEALPCHFQHQQEVVSSSLRKYRTYLTHSLEMPHDVWHQGSASGKKIRPPEDNHKMVRFSHRDM
jgi:hypothetical protein